MGRTEFLWNSHSYRILAPWSALERVVVQSGTDQAAVELRISEALSHRLRTLQLEAEGQGRGCVVDGVVLDPDGRAFVMKRSPGARVFGGCWDLPGGKVEAGESLERALARELREETGWRLRRIVALLGVADWEDSNGVASEPRRQFDFLVEIAGDLDRPRIEATKFSEYRWVGSRDLPLLQENRNPGDRVISDVVGAAIGSHRERWPTG
jgi:8-oxo-dGTP pyrophosphatase MutT (NUDIX family)